MIHPRFRRNAGRTPSRLVATIVSVAMASCACTRAEIPSSPAPNAAALACFERCRSLDDMDGVRCVARCPGAVVSDQACSDETQWCVHDKYLPFGSKVLIGLGGVALFGLLLFAVGNSSGGT